MSRSMRRFWDRRARENAFFFVDSRLDYSDPGADLDWFWEEGERYLDETLGQLGASLGSEDDAIDIGCGVGRFTRALAARARTVRALDVSPRMLELAREHNGHLENVEWIEGDGTTLAPIPDRSADACFSHVVFQHIPDPEITYGYVREMGRVLRPGGWAVFQVSNDPGVHSREHRGSRLRALLGRAPKGQDDPRWRGSAVDLDRLARAAADGGCRVQRTENAGSQFCVVALRRAEAA